MISTSGLHALIGTYNAAAGKLDPLTLDDIRRRDVRDFVQSVESSVVHYGESVGTFLKNLWNADAAGNGLGYVSAIAVEEKQVFDYNRGNPGSEARQILLALVQKKIKKVKKKLASLGNLN